MPKRTPDPWEPLEDLSELEQGMLLVSTIFMMPLVQLQVHKLVKGKRNIMPLNTSPAPCYRALRVFLCFPEGRSNFAEQGWSHLAAFLTRVSKDFSHSFFFFSDFPPAVCTFFSCQYSALQSFSSARMNYCILMDNLGFQDSAVPCEVKTTVSSVILSGVWCLFLYCVDKTGSKQSTNIILIGREGTASTCLPLPGHHFWKPAWLHCHFPSIFVPL